MLVLALNLGRVSADLRAGHGVSHSQDSSFPVLETYCAVYFDFLCVQIYVFTIVSGREECLTLMFKTELYFCL